MKLDLAIDVAAPDWKCFSPPQQRTVEREVAAYLASLVAALKLPVDASASLVTSDDLDGDAIRITFGDLRLRVSPRRGGPAPIASDTLDGAATQISRALFRARELLLTDAVVERVWKDWRAQSLVPDRRLRRWLVTQCVRYGWPLDEIGGALRQRCQVTETDAAARALWFELLRGRGPGRIGLRASKQLCGLLNAPPPGHEHHLPKMLELLGEGFFNELGIRIGYAGLKEDDGLAGHSFQATLNGLPLPPCRGLEDGEHLVNRAPDVLRDQGFEARAARAPHTTDDFAIVRGTPALAADLERAGMTTWSPGGHVVLGLATTARAEPGAFMTPDILGHAMAQLELIMPQRVGLVRERYGEAELASMLQGLLDEEISVRDQRTILETLACITPMPAIDVDRFLALSAIGSPLLNDGRTPLNRMRLEALRNSLKRHISHKYTRGGAILECYLLAHDVEDFLAGSAGPDGDGAQTARRFLAGVRSVLREHPADDTPSHRVVLPTMAARAPAREVLRLEFPTLPVVSYQDLSPDLDIRPIARINFGPDVA